MREDSLFRMYSMTRPVTSLAVMILWEEGTFGLDDPISRYLPQFEAQRVFVDADDPRMDRTRQRTGEITVEHLLLHTSGLGSRGSSIYRAEKVRLRSIAVEQMVDNAVMSEFPKWRKYLISLSFRGQSSVRPVQVGGFDVNIVIHRSTAVRGRGGPARHDAWPPSLGAILAHTDGPCGS